MHNLLLRSQKELSDVYALRWNEFEFLCSSVVPFFTQRELFNNVFDTDGNRLVDKLEVMCVICMHSGLSTFDKLEFMFELFNFNEKGYLTRSEVSLLLRTVVGGIFKADNSFVPPSKPIMDNILETSFQFARFNPEVLRKPELIAFVAETEVVRLFMDAWRGISSQALLPTGESWLDPTFLANITSITPSHHWLHRGLPPEQFVRWLRLPHVCTYGSIVGATTLFTHTTTTLKTADKKLVYSGYGCIGEGTLQQSFLADRWIMNAIALLVSKPIFVQKLFAATGQEDQGRYCVQLFEGVGQRSVFVDDCIPCGPTYDPLFLTSSDPNESWVLVLEKAIAKYLGSYGFIGHCSPRCDATLKAIQWLTGGHPIIYPTEDFEWKSISADVVRRDGASFAFQLFNEGSMIAFARSEAMLQVPRTAQMILEDREYAPHGRLFPVVGTLVEDSGYKILILKDIWGNFPGVTHLESPDLESGHCRVVRLKMEEIPLYFDTVVISRFPDAGRINAKAAKLKPWKTQVCRASSEGVTRPARFQLTIGGNAFDYVDVHTKEKQKTYTTPEEFRKQQVAEIAAKELEERGFAKTQEEKYKEKAAEVAFTISSGTDWQLAGDPAAGARIRIRIVPDKATLKALCDRRHFLRAKNLKLKILAVKSRISVRKADKAAQAKELAEMAAAKAALEIQSTADRKTAKLKAAAAKAGVNVDGSVLEKPEVTVETVEQPTAKMEPEKLVTSTVEEGLKPKLEAGAETKTSADAPGGSAPSFGEVAPEKKKLRKKYKIVHPYKAKCMRMLFEHGRRLEDNFQWQFSAERCWFSETVALMPGVYYLYADVSYAMPEWQLDERVNNLIRQYDISDMTNVEKASALGSVFAEGYHTAMARSPWKASMHDGSHDGYTPKVYLHVSSTNCFESLALPPDNTTVHSVKAPQHQHVETYPIESVADVAVPANTWPLMTESQSEASNRGMATMISKLRQEALNLNVATQKLKRKCKALYGGKRGVQQPAAAYS